MKKYIVVATIIGLMLVGSSAFALSTFKFSELNDYSYLQNDFTDAQNVKVSKFTEASTTCYVLTSKVIGYPTNLAISCIK